MEDKLNVSILDSFSKVDEKNIDQKLKEALQSFHKKLLSLMMTLLGFKPYTMCPFIRIGQRKVSMMVLLKKIVCFLS